MVCSAVRVMQSGHVSRPAQRRPDVVPAMLFSEGLNVVHMLDVVCPPKCCFNMWNIWGHPYFGYGY